MAVVPIEVVCIGEVPSGPLRSAITLANSTQFEFQFSLLPEVVTGDLALRAAREIKTTSLLDAVAAHRESARGFHPYIVAITDAFLAGEKYVNLFASARSESGLAVLTTNGVTPRIVPADRFPAYYIYYFARFALQFLSPNHKLHDETRGCIYDRKINKLDLLGSMNSRSLCDICREGLIRDRGILSPQQFQAADRLLALSGNIMTSGVSSKKPRVFIGSSTEGLHVAEKLQQLLAQQCTAIVWNQGTVFGLGDATLEALEQAVDEFDFGVFVFTPDDETQTRGVKRPVARDNVVFELGLFIGKLTRRRAFVVSPGSGSVALPSDLAGVTVAAYDPEERNVDAQLGPVATRLRHAILAATNTG